MLNNCRTVNIGWIFAFLFLLASCKSALLTFQGAVVKEDLRVVLEEDGAGDAAWETRDVSLRCQYKRADGWLELLGVVRIADHLRNSYDVMEFFHLTLFFLDADGRVIDSKNLSLGAYRNEIWEMPFERSVDAPESAGAIAFGYSGRAVNHRPGDDRPFFKLPFK
ncbi:MAG: hypothetical protein GY859_30790 [Desulfobacterales bacterium]|nr:hypothetical protein [Desulfobacterales bacterium]